MALHGPHQSAQKSVTTMREDWRTCVKCCGLVISTVLDIVIGGCGNRSDDQHVQCVVSGETMRIRWSRLECLSLLYLKSRESFANKRTKFWWRRGCLGKRSPRGRRPRRRSYTCLEKLCLIERLRNVSSTLLTLDYLISHYAQLATCFPSNAKSRTSRISSYQK